MRIRLMIGLLFTSLIALSLALPLTAQSSTATWTGAVFNNTTFTGTSVARTDTNLVLDFGTGTAPAAGIGTDNFSIRWTSTVNFTTSGTYRFTLRADDSAKLFLSGSTTPTLTTSGASTTAVTADVAITAGNVAMQVDYIEQTETASIALTWTLVTGSGTPTVTPAVTSVAPSTGWTIQYFGGTTISGPILATVPINYPQLNWGTGAPDAAVPFDNWSARITGTESFVPGVYRFEVRADDGVRVFVNGQRIIDKWGAHDGAETYIADVAIQGPSTIFIEYVELSNNAFVYYSVSRLPDGSIPGVGAGSSSNPSVNGSVVTISATGKIMAGTLNVREVPSVSGRVLAKVSFGQYYPVVGTNADRSWYQVRVAQYTGWVKSEFIRITQSSIPVTAPTNADLAVPNPVLAPQPAVVAPQAVSTGFNLQATANVVMHNAPSTQSTRSGLVPLGAAAEILGRNSRNSWWYVTQNLQVGWISGAYVLLPGNLDLSKVPVLQP